MNKSKYVCNLKKELFQPLHYLSKVENSRLKIVEIGAGSGANFSFFPDNVDIICIEPNESFVPYFEENKPDKFKDKVSYVYGFAENLEKIKSDSVDGVVCTLVMCSVDDQIKSVTEIKRVLKPGRSLYLYEHVKAPGMGFSYLMQILIQRIWWKLGHCRTCSDTKQLLIDSNFSNVDVKECYIPMPTLVKFMKYGLVGTATK